MQYIFSASSSHKVGRFLGQRGYFCQDRKIAEKVAKGAMPKEFYLNELYYLRGYYQNCSEETAQKCFSGVKDRNRMGHVDIEMAFFVPYARCEAAKLYIEKGAEQLNATDTNSSTASNGNGYDAFCA